MNLPSSTTRFLARNGGRIGYDVVGSGPLVVCLPGMGELRSLYRFTVPALVEAGLRVATMDLRGHGDSDATFDRYDDVAAGQDALALVEHLGGPAVLVGSSMGAGAAAWAAAERPELVAGLALLGPFVRDPAVGRLTALALRAAMAGPWSTRVWASYLPTLYPSRRPEDFAEHLGRVTASMRRPGYGRAFRATTRTSHAPVEARLAQVRTPALVVMGERDPDFPHPAAEAAWIGEQLGGEVVVVPEAGHYPHVERADAVTPQLVAFARRVAVDA